MKKAITIIVAVFVIILGLSLFLIVRANYRTNAVSAQSLDETSQKDLLQLFDTINKTFHISPRTLALETRYLTVITNSQNSEEHLLIFSETEPGLGELDKSEKNGNKYISLSKRGPSVTFSTHEIKMDYQGKDYWGFSFYRTDEVIIQIIETERLDDILKLYELYD